MVTSPRLNSQSRRPLLGGGQHRHKDSSGDQSSASLPFLLTLIPPVWNLNNVEHLTETGTASCGLLFGSNRSSSMICVVSTDSKLLHS